MTSDKFPNVKRLMMVAGLVSAMSGKDSYSNDLDSALYEEFIFGDRPVEVNNTMADTVLEFIDGEWVPYAVQEGY